MTLKVWCVCVCVFYGSTLRKTFELFDVSSSFMSAWHRLAGARWFCLDFWKFSPFSVYKMTAHELTSFSCSFISFSSHSESKVTSHLSAQCIGFLAPVHLRFRSWFTEVAIIFFRSCTEGLVCSCCTSLSFSFGLNIKEYHFTLKGEMLSTNVHCY